MACDIQLAVGWGVLACPQAVGGCASAAEGVAADAAGNVYGAEVGPRALKTYVRK